MKNTLKELFIFIIIIISYIYITTNITYISTKIIYILKLSITKIIPIIFPTLILSNILYSSKIPELINKYLKINPIYILSFITGSPTNAYILNKYENKTKILSLTNYPSIIFLYSYLNNIFNKKTAIILIIFNIISNIIIYFIIKPNKLDYKTNTKISLTNSITNSIHTTINIIAFCIFYAILPTSLIQNQYIKTLLLSITEITSSLENLSITNLPFNIKLLFTIITISSTGLCIQSQILSITKELNIKEYIKNRLLHLVIYLTLTLIFFNYLK